MQKKFKRPEPTLSEDDAAIWDLVKMGLLVDSGQKMWSEETGRFEIVWRSAGNIKTLH